VLYVYYISIVNMNATVYITNGRIGFEFFFLCQLEGSFFFE
jgi:hypothetical protein